MSIYYRTLIKNGLLLDMYPNAQVAYSLRKLRSSYSGSAIRVRRSVDNIEEDFGFRTNGDLDAEGIESFVGQNMWNWSEDLTQTSWTKGNSTITPNILVAPDGNTTGDVIYETTANGTHTISRANGTITSGLTYTISFWVQAQGRNFIRIVTPTSLSTNPGTSGIAWINLSTGSIISQNSGFINGASNANLQVTSAPNGWCFISFTQTASSTASVNFFSINLSTDGSTISYAGNTSLGIALWGAQLSQKNSVQTYQKTDALAGGNGFITTWYDQTGNGFTATQGTAGSQAQIALNGNIIRNSLNKISSTWNASWYSISSSPGNLTGSNFSVSVMGRTSATSLVSFGNTAIGGRPRFPVWINTGNIDINTINYGSDTGLGVRLISSYVNSGTGGVFVNGSPLVNTPSPMTDQPTTNCTTIGRFTSTGGSSGETQEMVWWKQNLLSVRSGIEQNINQYYGIY